MLKKVSSQWSFPLTHTKSTFVSLCDANWTFKPQSVYAQPPDGVIAAIFMLLMRQFVS